MDLPVKQRLVGAIVLVAIAVAFVPAILDGPELQSDRRTTALELPVPEQPSSKAPERRVQTVRLEPEAGAVADKPPVRPSTAARAAPVPAQSSPPQSSPKKTAPKESPSESSSPSGSSAPSRPAVSDTWYVQLGSFGELGNAQRLARDAKADGFEAQISTVVAQGKTMHRVRVGPVATREQAESLRQSLAAKGQPGKIATGG